MPHYILVTLDDDQFQHITQAHEHVVHALHGHGRALGGKAQHRDVFPIHQHRGQKLDLSQIHDPHVLSEGEVVHLVAPPGYQLALHQYHADGMTEHHTEVTIQKNEDWEQDSGFKVPVAGWKPSEVPAEIEDTWPQHEPLRR